MVLRYILYCWPGIGYCPSDQMCHNKHHGRLALRPDAKFDSVASGHQRDNGYVPPSLAAGAYLPSSDAKEKEVWASVDILVWIYVRRPACYYVVELLI